MVKKKRTFSSSVIRVLGKKNHYQPKTEFPGTITGIVPENCNWCTTGEFFPIVCFKIFFLICSSLRLQSMKTPLPKRGSLASQTHSLSAVLPPVQNVPNLSCGDSCRSVQEPHFKTTKETQE